MENHGLTVKDRLAILAVALLSFSGILIETSMNVTFPVLTKQLGVSLGTIQWLTTGYLLLVTIVMATTAMVLKRFASQKIFVFASTISLSGTLFCAVAANFPLLLIGRLLQAVATGLSTPLLFNVITTTVPRKQIGSYIGLAAMILSTAPALGPTYGGLLTGTWGWRWIFWLMLPFVGLVLLLGRQTIKIPASGTEQKFDYVALLILAAGLFSFEWAVSLGGQHGWTSGSFISQLVITAGIVLGMIWQQKHSLRRLLNWRIMRQRLVSLRAINYFLLQLINLAIAFLLPVYLEEAVGVSTTVAGLSLLPGAILGAITAPLAGRWYDRVGSRWPLNFSNAIIVIILLVWVLLAGDFGVLATILLFSGLRIGVGMGYGNTMSDASKAVPHIAATDQNSLFNMLQQYAGSLGTGVMAALIMTATQSMPQKEVLAVTKGTRWSLWLLLGLALLSWGSTILSQFTASQDIN